MKWKISTIILAMALIMTACESDTDGRVVNASEYDDEFGMEYVGYDYDIYGAGRVKLYEDKQTHVEYIIVGDDKCGLGITPRYNPDGSLYVRK